MEEEEEKEGPNGYRAVSNTEAGASNVGCIAVYGESSKNIRSRVVSSNGDGVVVVEDAGLDWNKQRQTRNLCGIDGDSVGKTLVMLEG